MQYDTMIQTLERRLGDTGGNADTVFAATVQAISEAAWKEADDFRAQLPQQLASVAPSGPGPERTLDEFLARVGELSGTQDMSQAQQYARAAFSVLADAISSEQLRHLMQALPQEYGSLAPAVSGLTGDEETLLAEVRRLAGLADIEEARLLAQTVLAVLAEAISRGPASRIAAALPEDLSAFLQSSPSAEHTDTDRFLAEVTRRSAVTEPDVVREHTAAVFVAVRQWSPQGLADALGQLPHPLAQLSV